MSNMTNQLRGYMGLLVVAEGNEDNDDDVDDDHLLHKAMSQGPEPQVTSSYFSGSRGFSH